MIQISTSTWVWGRDLDLPDHFPYPHQHTLSGNMGHYKHPSVLRQLFCNHRGEWLFLSFLSSWLQIHRALCPMVILAVRPVHKNGQGLLAVLLTSLLAVLFTSLGLAQFPVPGQLTLKLLCHWPQTSDRKRRAEMLFLPICNLPKAERNYKGQIQGSLLRVNIRTLLWVVVVGIE
jgi:hypothetical protein